MKRFVCVLLVLLALPAVRVNAGKVVTDSLRSAVLDAQVKFNVYLPDGFDKSARKYPVVYLLHGLYGSYTNWVENMKMKGIADELIASGEAVPMIIVMPNAGHPDAHNVQNGYFNMPGWHYEDFFFGELVPEVEKKYSCGGSKERRAVMGLSMGGGGSVVYCQKHPEMFACCYALSPWLDDKGREVEGEETTSDKLYLVSQAVRDNSAVDFLDRASEETIEKLRTVAWFVDCGDDDFLLHLAMEFHFKMKAAGVHNELRVRNGIHNWEYWHLGLRLALPFASRNFE